MSIKEFDSNYKFEIKETGKYGIGVFANEQIKSGQVIITLRGEVVSLNECVVLVNQGSVSNNDPLQIGIEMYMVLDKISRAFNHNCDPNAGIRKVSELFALKNIEIGEEITYDYSTVVGTNNPPADFSMKCKCGAKLCRRVICNVATIPDENISRYYRQDAFQDYMKQHFGKVLLCKFNS